MLFLGRVLGGISGTLLWSVFESWLVAEFNKLMVENSEPLLSGIFSTMTTSNTCVAIVAGIAAGWLVDRFGTAKAPFLVSIGCLSVAFVAISKYWVSARVLHEAEAMSNFVQGENYGSSNRNGAEAAALLQQEEAEPASPPLSPLRMILRGE